MSLKITSRARETRPKPAAHQTARLPDGRPCGQVRLRELAKILRGLGFKIDGATATHKELVRLYGDAMEAEVLAKRNPKAAA